MYVWNTIKIKYVYRIEHPNIDAPLQIAKVFDSLDTFAE